MKFYRGSASAARSYVEADRSRVDDYYLAEGTGVAERYVATIAWHAGGRGVSAVQHGGTLDGDAYERWVAGYDVVTGAAKGRLRDDARALRFVEVVVNGPKSWSLAAALHPDIAAAYDAAMDRAAGEVIGWVGEHATTRVGPRGRQVQVPVEKLEAAVVRHYTSRAGDPHRHLHVQINARVFARGAWRGLHSVGVVDSIEALNGIGHAAVMCDPEFRAALAARGYTLDDDGEIEQLAPYAGGFSQRAAQIGRNVDRYEAAWRSRAPRPGARAAAAPVPGTDAPGRTRDPTRSCPAAAPTSSPHGTTSCATSASPHRPPRRPTRRQSRVCRSAGSTATSPPTSCSPGSARSGRRGTPPTSVARSND